MFKSQLARDAIMNIDNVDKTLIGWAVSLIAGAGMYITKIREYGKRLDKLDGKVYPEDSNHRLATAEDLKTITNSIATQGKCIGEIKVMVARLDERNPKKK